MNKRNSLGKKLKLCSLNFNLSFNKSILVLAILIVTLLSMYVRYLMTPFATQDVVGFVFVWLKDIKEVGFKNFYKVDADYSSFYLFIIGLASFLPEGEVVKNNYYSYPVNWMYYLKTILFILDFLTAIAFGLIVKYLTKNNTKGAIAYMIYLVLPVQMINSSVWGNNDSMYFVCFAWAIYFILKRKDFLAYFFVGLAFSFKLQAVFIMPFIVYLILSRRLKFYPIFMMFVALFLSFAPAYICGASFIQPFQYFYAQVNGYSNLTLGCANFWHFFSIGNMDSSSSVINQASLYIGLLLIFALTCIIYLRKIKMNNDNVLFVSVFLIGIVPFFLPHMHERYFYALDCLVVVYALISKKKYYLIPMMQISSGISYYHYLSLYGTEKYFIDILGEDSVTIAAIINLIVLTIIFIDLMKLPHKTRKEDIEDIKNEIKEIKKSNEKVSSLEEKEDALLSGIRID